MVVATKKKPAGKPAGKAKAPAKPVAKAKAPAKPVAKAKAPAKGKPKPPVKATKPKPDPKPAPAPTPEPVQQTEPPAQGGWGATLQQEPVQQEADYTPPAFLGLKPEAQVADPQPATRAAPPIGHNAVNKELVAFVERLERLAEERAGITDDMKEVVSEAKGRGFDAAILRKVLTRRRMDADKRRTQDELLDNYEHALGMVR